MQDSKEIGWADHLGAEEDAGESLQDVGEAANESDAADGWQQYRRWISKAPAPRNRRSSIDPALYTWKGYRNWTEQVKRKWPEGNE